MEPSRSGYIALTDPDWYRHLRSFNRVEEVNFWQPRGGRVFRALTPGDLFFFKLRAPEKAIAGFGFFQRFEILPAWLAWECFTEMNGAPDFEVMVNRILQLRGESATTVRSGDFKIGCIMITAPFFFSETNWVEPPTDWARTGIQQGKTYDLMVGEGRRVLSDCLARAQAGLSSWNVEQVGDSAHEDAARYGAAIPVRPRLGQGTFSREVRYAYEGSCAVTHEHSEPVLEAAHIIPYAKGGEHRVDNGLLLRRDLHKLFDRGYVTVTEDYEFRVGKSLGDEYGNGKSYYSSDRSKIMLPKVEADRPNREFLEWHRHEVFRG